MTETLAPYWLAAGHDDGRGPDGSLPPNNWRSIFGGPVWRRVFEPDGAPG
jgi:hypothetical protein